MIHTLDKDVSGPVALHVGNRTLAAPMERGAVVLSDARRDGVEIVEARG